jgi:putative SOS response-associated peptidase YedK
MCGRFTLTRPDLDELVCEFGAELDAEITRLHRPRWNIAPTNTHVVLKTENGSKRLVPARFGLEGPGGRFVINARSETAATLRTFRSALAQQRCVVPADGFYEWQGARGDRRPLWFHRPDGGLLFFAGLAFERQDARSFVILTTPANDLLRPVHDRMPALLSREAAEAWLAHPDEALLVPAPEGFLAFREVSDRVNDVANDGPDLLKSPTPKRQLTLV